MTENCIDFISHILVLVVAYDFLWIRKLASLFVLRILLKPMDCSMKQVWYFGDQKLFNIVTLHGICLRLVLHGFDPTTNSSRPLEHL